ncbi:MAG TPA: hypothetical protein VFI29_12405 [Hanamia sp.]|nr:hypothetical protein [Hanamia sp.]
MKKLIFIVLLFCGFTAFSSVPVDMSKVRSLYKEAVKSEDSCKELVAISSGPNEKNNPLMLGYKGSGTMLMAKHVFNPFTKMSYFKKGKQMLEKAIELDENNIELRFLRFNAQTNMPSFLGYNSSIENDKKFLLNRFSQITEGRLKEFVLEGLKNSKYLTENEKYQLK